MIFRFAAAFALVLEVLLHLHLIAVPFLHDVPPFTITGLCFTVAFCLSEFWETLAHGVRQLRRAL